MARVVSKPLANGPDPAQAAIVFGEKNTPALLESLGGHPVYGRWSVFACDPCDVFVVAPDYVGDPLAALSAHLARYPQGENPLGLPFAGGWIGYVSYEAGARLEGVYPACAAGTAFPLVRLGLYDAAAVFDHHTQRWQVVAVDWPCEAGLNRPRAEERLARVAALLESAAARAASADEDAQQGGEAGTPRADWTRAEYLERVRAAQAYIAAGDVYEVNLTQRFVGRTAATPLQLYLDLRRANPADYAAFLAWDAGAVLSSSPELFLDLRAGRVITRPIKGTRPRCGDPQRDALHRRELAHSEKERAELNMIIDLLRNDLGRVCAVGSIRVESAGELEEHPTVFHRVATLTGRLAAGRDAVDLLRATAPGGSITGAPKIRAMQIINALEMVQRGVYCGSVGYLGLDGRMVMNIAIRTMLVEHGRVHIHAGGAIVADSVPEAEYEETLAKAAGMFRAWANHGEPVLRCGSGMPAI